ncbi:hypothetical protein BDZ91DRAFT_368501 [Kalaharituber pfeilii]|nr:hypothetical protein BDZ91DRAFT_368501 [Kalaharituber pfeilii]
MAPKGPYYRITCGTQSLVSCIAFSNSISQWLPLISILPELDGTIQYTLAETPLVRFSQPGGLITRLIAWLKRAHVHHKTRQFPRVGILNSLVSKYSHLLHRFI